MIILYILGGLGILALLFFLWCAFDLSARIDEEEESH